MVGRRAGADGPPRTSCSLPTTYCLMDMEESSLLPPLAAAAAPGPAGAPRHSVGAASLGLASDST